MRFKTIVESVETEKEEKQKTPEAQVKAKLTAALATLQLATPKYTTKDYSEKSIFSRPVKALKGGSVGPMTASSAWAEVCIGEQNKVRKLFSELDVNASIEENPLFSGLINFEIKVPLNAKKQRVIKFDWQKLAAYGSHRDPEYKNWWFIYSFVDEKI